MKTKQTKRKRRINYIKFLIRKLKKSRAFILRPEPHILEVIREEKSQAEIARQ